MKAIILAAGEGTRMRPLTLETPKPLLKINGRPILDHIFEALPEEIIDVIVVTKYLGEKIRAYLGEEHRGKRVLYAEGSEKGTAYSFKATEKFFENGERFLFLYGDEFSSKEDIKACLSRPLSAIVSAYNQPQKAGVVSINKEGCIVDIEEKPEKPKTNIIVGGIMVLDTRVFQYQPFANQKGEYYFTSVLKQFIKKHPVHAVFSKCFLGDITMPDDLRRIESTLKKLTDT